MKKKDKIRLVCSLGFNCHIAQFLKSNGLKLASYPFDWIMSNTRVVKHCLEDNFVKFLDKTCYTELNRPDRCGHNVYCDNMFVHHNPLDNMGDYDYFDRCVNRFKDLLNRKEKKLFMVSIINGEHNVGNKLTDDIKNQFIELNNIIKARTTNYHLLVVVNYPNKNENNYVLTKTEEIVFLEIDTISLNVGTHYQNENDNIYLYTILKKMYNFKLLSVANIEITNTNTTVNDYNE